MAAHKFESACTRSQIFILQSPLGAQCALLEDLYAVADPSRWKAAYPNIMTYDSVFLDHCVLSVIGAL